jgi:hypothetical protein
LGQLGNPIPREDRLCLYASTEPLQRPPQPHYKRNRSRGRCLQSQTVAKKCL